MRWNESVPLPNKTFNLPGFNVSGKDVKNFEARQRPSAKEVNVTAEVNARVQEKLSAEAKKKEEEKKEEVDKRHVAMS
jgi:hypothetical protein